MDWTALLPGLLPTGVAALALILSNRNRGQDRLDQRLSRVNERLDKINDTLTDLNGRVARIEGWIERDATHMGPIAFESGPSRVSAGVENRPYGRSDTLQETP